MHASTPAISSSAGPAAKLTQSLRRHAVDETARGSSTASTTTPARSPGRRHRSRAICLNTRPTMAARLAPSALRTASSRDRWVTPCDSTANRPVPAISSANSAKPPSSIAYDRGCDRLAPTRCSIVSTESRAMPGPASRTTRAEALHIRGRVALGAHDDGCRAFEVEARQLRHRHEHLRLRRAIDRVLLEVVDDADDRASAPARSTAARRRSCPATAPSRVSIGTSSRYCVTNERLTTTAVGVPAIGVGERAAGANADAERAEVAGRDEPANGLRLDLGAAETATGT